MSTIKGYGVVIRETNVGESNKLITVLLKDYGKINISCKGARNTKSKFLSGTQLFSYGEFVVFQGRGFNSLVSVDLIESFYNIRKDYDKLCYGYYFLEMANKLLLDGEPSNDFILLLINGLKQLAKESIDGKLVCVIYELKFLFLMGHQPASEFCYVCNKKYVDFGGKVFFGSNGILCGKCGSVVHNKIMINKTIVYVINFVINNNYKEIFNFEIPEKDILNLYNCTKIFIKNNMDTNFISLNEL